MVWNMRLYFLILEATKDHIFKILKHMLVWVNKVKLKFLPISLTKHIGIHRERFDFFSSEIGWGRYRLIQGQRLIKLLISLNEVNSVTGTEVPASWPEGSSRGIVRQRVAAFSTICKGSRLSLKPSHASQAMRSSH